MIKTGMKFFSEIKESIRKNKDYSEQVIDDSDSSMM